MFRIFRFIYCDSTVTFRKTVNSKSHPIYHIDCVKVSTCFFGVQWHLLCSRNICKVYKNIFDIQIDSVTHRSSERSSSRTINHVLYPNTHAKYSSDMCAAHGHIPKRKRHRFVGAPSPSHGCHVLQSSARTSLMGTPATGRRTTGWRCRTLVQNDPCCWWLMLLLVADAAAGASVVLVRLISTLV